MSTAEFTLSYDGEAVQTGLMDVRELAPAMLATATLLQQANQIANGNDAHISLNVRSEFRRGSFPVDFVVVQSLLDQAKGFLLNHPKIKDAKEILEIVFFYCGGAAGLFRLLKWLKGRTPESDQVVFTEGNDNVQIQIGGDVQITNQNVYNLYLNQGARRAASDLVAPLRREGIDRVDVKMGDQTETIMREEAQYFEYDCQGEPAIDSTSEALVEVVRLSFNPEHKWGFFDGNRNFTAKLEDDKFWKRIDGHAVSFAEGDKLRVMLRTQSHIDEKGEIKADRSIVEVLEHIPQARPRRLPFPTEPQKFRSDENDW